MELMNELLGWSCGWGGGRQKLSSAVHIGSFFPKLSVLRGQEIIGVLSDRYGHSIVQHRARCFRNHQDPVGIHYTHAGWTTNEHFLGHIGKDAHVVTVDHKTSCAIEKRVIL